MDYLEKEMSLTGMTQEQLEQIGLTSPSLKEVWMCFIAKYVTDTTKHPSGLPKIFGNLCGFFCGGFDQKKDWFDIKRKTRKVKLENGRKLHATYCTCPDKYKKDDGKTRLVIFSHGYNSVSTFMLHYYAAYMEQGFDCVYYDQRGHGEAKKDYACSMGYWEADDLVDIAAYYRKKFGRDAIIGVHGESMGSGTGAFALHRLDTITDFTVLDCGYSTMDEMAKWIEHLLFMFPKQPMHDLVDLLSAVDGKKYSDVDGLGEVAKTRQNYPVLFVHGSIDFFVATHFSKDMAAAKKGKSDLKIYPFAFHAMSQMIYPKQYKMMIKEWLQVNHVD